MYWFIKDKVIIFKIESKFILHCVSCNDWVISYGMRSKKDVLDCGISVKLLDVTLVLCWLISCVLMKKLLNEAGPFFKVYISILYKILKFWNFALFVRLLTWALLSLKLISLIAFSCNFITRFTRLVLCCPQIWEP